MKIPKEIQDLMPERAECVEECAYAEYGEAMECTCGAVERNKTLTEVEAVLPQIIALAEKRGAEEEIPPFECNICSFGKPCSNHPPHLLMIKTNNDVC